MSRGKADRVVGGGSLSHAGDIHCTQVGVVRGADSLQGHIKAARIACDQITAHIRTVSYDHIAQCQIGGAQTSNRMTVDVDRNRNIGRVRVWREVGRGERDGSDLIRSDIGTIERQS